MTEVLHEDGRFYTISLNLCDSFDLILFQFDVAHLVVI